MLDDWLTLARGSWLVDGCDVALVQGEREDGDEGGEKPTSKHRAAGGS